MGSDPTLELVCRVAAVAVAGSAVLLAAWGRFWDQARERRRCPRCWYDMAGLPGLTCPECGRTARDERSLAKTRGRRWTLLGAIVVLVAARVAWRAPEIWQRGWVAAVPSSVLIPVATATEPFDQPPPPPGATDYPPPGRWASELAARAAAGELASWQWRWLLTRVGYIRSRERWPEDHQWVPHVGLPYWLEYRFSQRFTVGEADLRYLRRNTRVLLERVVGGGVNLPPDGRTVRVTLELFLLGAPAVATRTLWTGVLRLPVQTVPVLSDAVAPDASEELSGVVLANVTIEFHFGASAQRQGGAFHLTLDLEADPRLRDLAPGFAVDLLRDGRPFGSPVPFEVLPSARTTLKVRSMALWDLPPWWQEEPHEIDRWAIRLRGDAENALHSHRGTVYWDGEIVIPLAELKIVYY